MKAHNAVLYLTVGETVAGILVMNMMLIAVSQLDPVTALARD